MFRVKRKELHVSRPDNIRLMTLTRKCLFSHPWFVQPRTIKTSLSCLTTTHSSLLSSRSLESFLRFAVKLSTATQYSRTKASMSYVEFHLVVTSRGMRRSGRSVFATQSFQAGRSSVVELTILNASLQTWMEAGHVWCGSIK